jgi:uncharacterized protein with von Willebrand factor type A (vWA) domain
MAAATKKSREMTQQRLPLTAEEVARGEIALEKRLRAHGVSIGAPRTHDAGVTDLAMRRERYRAAICGYGLQAVIVPRARKGRAMTYREYFERLYGVALDEASPRGKP